MKAAGAAGGWLKLGDRTVEERGIRAHPLEGRHWVSRVADHSNPGLGLLDWLSHRRTIVERVCPDVPRYRLPKHVE